MSKLCLNLRFVQLHETYNKHINSNSHVKLRPLYCIYKNPCHNIFLCFAYLSPSENRIFHKLKKFSSRIQSGCKWNFNNAVKNTITRAYQLICNIFSYKRHSDKCHTLVSTTWNLKDSVTLQHRILSDKHLILPYDKRRVCL